MESNVPHVRWTCSSEGHMKVCRLTAGAIVDFFFIHCLQELFSLKQAVAAFAQWLNNDEAEWGEGKPGACSFTAPTDR